MYINRRETKTANAVNQSLPKIVETKVTKSSTLDVKIKMFPKIKKPKWRPKSTVIDKKKKIKNKK